MTITETTTVTRTTQDSRTAVHAVRFSHPTVNAPTRRWAGTPAGSAQPAQCASVLFLAPSDDH